MFRPYFHTAWLLKLLYPYAVWKKSSSEKTLYLTFDDGPIPEITEFVINELAKVNAKATFFCIGNNILKHREEFEKIVRSGHSIGNHTCNHLNGWKSFTDDYLKDVYAFEKIYPTNIFRPPYGKIKPSQLREIRKTHQVIFWDKLSGDFDITLTKENCLRKCFENVSNGSIIVFHDSIKAKENLEYVLPRFLNHFSSLGYQFIGL